MFTKCLSYGALFVVSLIAVSIVYSSSASAYGTCTGSAEYDVFRRLAIDNEKGDLFETENVTWNHIQYIDTNGGIAGYVIPESTNGAFTTTKVLDWNWNRDRTWLNIQLSGSIPSGVKVFFYQIDSYYGVAAWWEGENTSVEQTFEAARYPAVDCFTRTTFSLVYSDDFPEEQKGAGYEFTGITNEPKYGEEVEEECGIWDAACFMGKVIGDIVDTFQGLFDGMKNMFTALGEFIGGIFINEEGVNVFGQFWGNIFSGMHEKLGFLTFPFDFMSSFLGSWNGAPTTCVSVNGQYNSSCTLDTSFIFGSHLRIDFGTMEKHIPQLWTIAKWVTRAGLTVSMIFIVHRKYFETVES